MKRANRFNSLLSACTVAGAIALSGMILWQGNAWALGGEAAAVTLPAPTIDEPANASHSETAIFAGGCFWGVQGVFQHVKGVTGAVSGYAGGAAKTANYDNVSTGMTGHAESVAVTFDPTQVSYGALLQIFFSVVHDPTELNRQGPDSGTQYRSAIFPQSAAQQRIASAYLAQLQASRSFERPLMTRIESNAHFYSAEAYHQNFLTDHPDAPYIRINDLPKIKQLEQRFPTRYRPQPVLVNVNAR
ncbi:peptide-methionine (S)-S-oxide reductase MsrA [Serratia marcescens]|jgi:peptide-methionine (S)-S-oxide reductase|uniref:Peptide methionine sulfoxide reductase MsrA n=1 Tax=Serratia surfactantfaciens TaxID=2741499 RepID=A0ABS0M0G3_9GAMM|nr:MULTISPECIES: peptide-methionine (S)-S-oxide reductase MsrA [Serratia]MBH1921058.1 peptide-methionine (S)-S-oxide reductase MsrA [Serratia surfactantfaciens]ULH10404.1 peptide-methionine (S)-S-oxide reductase MsrA [Serratia marcescens]